jgi:type II secretory pathway component PulJ
LIELMAATTVLSVVLLMMVGMQDQMSKAWSNANRRTDATREARAACRLRYEDLAFLVYREQTFDNQAAGADVLINQGIPFLYSSNGLGPITIANAQSGASYFFAVTARKPVGSGLEDLALVGYYIASAPRTNVNGFATTNFNLYRYYVPASNTVSNLNTWFSSSTRTASMLFKPNPATDDILARNTCNLRITPYNRIDGNTRSLPNKVANGLNYQFVSSGTTSYYSGSKLQVELSVYPEDYAQRISYAAWTNSTNIQKYARSYEFRVDVRRD